MNLSEIDYSLPVEAIAQTAIEPRDSARLLCCHPDGTLLDSRIGELPRILEPGDLLVVNESRVRRARVAASRESGGRAEILFLNPLKASPDSDGWWEALVRPSRRIRIGEEISTEGGLRIEVGQRIAGGRRMARFVDRRTDEALNEVGSIPLPPYFTGSLDSDDRYQTCFARTTGSAAAPTAGLHFTSRLLDALNTAEVSVVVVDLEVGVDTFRPVSEEDPFDHAIHTERYSIPEATATAISDARARGGAVVAVGTTSLRAIESATSDSGFVSAGSGSADLLLGPGSKFHVDGLLTNFHAPRTTLILLLAGLLPKWRDAYSYALREGYRFLSFGDAMLVMPRRK